MELNLEQLDSLEDVENCIYYYNYAVFLYHLKHYTKALAMINKVYSFIESLGNHLLHVIFNLCSHVIIIEFVIEESLAHKVCLLIVQLHIDTNKHAEALKLITYIESQFVSTDNATNILTGSADQGGPIHAETEKTEKV